jgi:hypothetical protein
MELRKRGNGKENDKVSVISYNVMCDGREDKDVY